VRAAIRRLPVPRQDLDDALQGGALGLLEALEHFEQARGASFGTFARGYVLRGVLDAVFAGRRRVPRLPAPTEVSWESIGVDLPADSLDPAETLVEREFRQVVATALLDLPEPSRRLLSDVYAGVPQAEIARRRSVSRTAVSKHLARIHRGLRARCVDTPAA
jgi:RNA polymerase sigma factor (sigma-70 family)